jgi:hypothetical protein
VVQASRSLHPTKVSVFRALLQQMSRLLAYLIALPVRGLSLLLAGY